MPAQSPRPWHMQAAHRHHLARSRASMPRSRSVLITTGRVKSTSRSRDCVIPPSPR